MKVLRARLSEVGVKRSFLNNVVLPSWWEDSIALDAGGLREAAAYIASHLGFSLESLMDQAKKLDFAGQGGVKYKKAKGVTKEEICLATQYSLGVARTAAAAFAESPPPKSVPSPEEWRLALLEISDRPWVCLRHILKATWELGIPVLHVKNIPSGAKKPDALTTIIGDRPVIAVLNARKSPSWLAFIVAHELGHIHHRHLKTGQTLVDEKIDSLAGEDDEKEANDFAALLLTGHRNLGLHSSRSLNLMELAKEAKTFGRDYRIAPGVAALNYGFTTGDWKAAMGAVCILEKDDDASEYLAKSLKTHLPSDSLAEEALDWIMRATTSPA